MLASRVQLHSSAIARTSRPQSFTPFTLQISVVALICRMGTPHCKQGPVPVDEHWLRARSTHRDIGASGEQQVDHCGVPLARGEHERREAAPVLKIELDPWVG